MAEVQFGLFAGELGPVFAAGVFTTLAKYFTERLLLVVHSEEVTSSTWRALSAVSDFSVGLRRSR